VATAYKRATLDETWDAIVIGSGLGGLSAAALLAKHAGRRVLVLERHYTPGGYTHAFHRSGFDWDVGVHYVGNVVDRSANVRGAFDHVTDGRLRWEPMPAVYDEVRIADRRYAFTAGRETFREQLIAAFPRERRGIDRYMNAISDIDAASFPFFAEKGLPRALSAVAGPFMRARFLRYAKRTTADTLAEFTTDRELAGVLAAQWGDYGLPPAQSSFGVHAITAHHYLAGGAFPIGGGAQIAASIAPLIEAAGGTIAVGANVTEIVLDRRGRATGVRMADGREFRAPCIVSNAGAHNTFQTLLAPVPERRSEFTDRIKAIAPSTAYINLYVGLDATAAELGLNGSNIWVHPTNDHDANSAAFASDSSAPFPFLFISFPSAKDPDFERRHPGHATIDILTFVPYVWFAKWENTRWGHRGADYERFKDDLAGRLRCELERCVPAVRGHIVHAELSTPLTTQHFANYRGGEAYGLQATPERFALRGLRAQTPIPNLYLTGQDVVMVGVTGALFGGIIAASAILKRNLVGVVTKPFDRPTKTFAAIDTGRSLASRS
jgi:all-trans-retinol 13,14-reductase